MTSDIWTVYLLYTISIVLDCTTHALVLVPVLLHVGYPGYISGEFYLLHWMPLGSGVIFVFTLPSSLWD